MKQHMPFPRYLAAAFLLLTGLAWGCIKDSRDHCYTSYRLVVNTMASDSVRDSDISEVVLFIFNKEQKFMGTINTRVNQVTELPYPSDNELYVVAWGNINGDNQLLSTPATGQSPGEFNLKLKMKNNDFALSPNDLFQGAKAINQQENDIQPDVLLIKRKVANVKVVTRGLQDFLGTTDVDFTYVIRGTIGTLDLNGVFIGNEIRLQPDAAFNERQEFGTTAFNVFPSTHLAVDVYKGNQLVYTADKDDAGNSFAAPEGKRLTITIDLTGNTRVTISISDWITTDINSEQ